MKKLLLFFMLLFTFLQATYIKTDGIVTDTETGLVWQDNYTDNDGNVKHDNWYNAISYCNDLDALGYDDWRLPNVNELVSITDITKGTEPDTIGDVRAISDVFDLTLFSTLEDVPWFWSSTTHASNIMVAWGVCFLDGHISPHDKIETDDRYRHVRCVRDQGGNTPPLANAGPDQNSVTGTLLTLDGSASSDPEGDTLTYIWSFTSRPAGSTAVLTNPTAVDPTFTPDIDGEYVVQLIVNDGTVDSAPDSVTVIAGEAPPSNIPPIADAGPDKTVQVNNTITISGSGSDSDGSIVAYQWIKQSTGQVLANTATFDFTPTGTRTKTLVLTVTDDDGATASDTMILTVTDGPVGNTPPTADAGPDQNSETGTLVTLDGSGSSDVDNDAITYSWSFTSRPAGSTAILIDPTSINPTFTPDVNGSYVVQLIVNDGTVNSAPDSVTVTAGETPPTNTPPTADAGPDKTVQVNHTVTITGSGSDSDGSIVAYQWIKQSTGQLLATTPTFDFTPTGTRTKILVLTVTDDDGETASDEMVLTVTDGPVGNIPPIADAGPDKTVQVNHTVTISGSGSDSDGSIVAYQWIKQSTGQVLANTATFNFTPTGTLTKTLVLTVTDDDGATASDTMILTVTRN
jgi:hypothetical protein